MQLRHEINLRLAWALFGAMSVGATPTIASEAHCATSKQVASIRAAFAKPNPSQPFAVAQELKLPESLVVSALPAAHAHGVDATHFQAIWSSLTAWENSVFVVMKGGNVFETYGKVFVGEPSKRSKYFNLHGEGAGMSGQLRPDLLSAIYVVAIPGKESVLRGVLFYDKEGSGVFAVFVPGEGGKPSDTLIRQFEDTFAEVRTLPEKCPRS
jgi:putative heme iron utilization protein